MQDFHSKKPIEPDWLRNFQYIPDERPVWERWRVPRWIYLLGVAWIVGGIGYRLLTEDLSLWDGALTILGAAGIGALWAFFRGGREQQTLTRRWLLGAVAVAVIATWIYIAIAQT